MKILILVLLFNTAVFAQKTVVKKMYKKRQKIDLGALTVDGKISSPGDFSVETEDEKSTKMLYKRKNYDDRIRINIQYVF